MSSTIGPAPDGTPIASGLVPSSGSAPPHTAMWLAFATAAYMPDHALRGRHLGVEPGRARMIGAAHADPRRRRSRARARSRFRRRATSPDGPCRCRHRPARSRARERVTVMFGRLLKPPALSRRTYCGRRNTPCASAPVRSASPISSAQMRGVLARQAGGGQRILDQRPDRRDRHAALVVRFIAHAHKSARQRSAMTIVNTSPIDRIERRRAAEADPVDQRPGRQQPERQAVDRHHAHAHHAAAETLARLRAAA